MQQEQDLYWLHYALKLARQAACEGEVPVGAVLVCNDILIGEGYNQPIKNNDPTAHAEIIALRHAAQKIGNYRLINSTLYVTLEPCMMCAGALIHARISRLHFGAHDPKAGAIISRCKIHDIAHNHDITVTHGLLEVECANLLQDFFEQNVDVFIKPNCY